MPFMSRHIYGKYKTSNGLKVHFFFMQWELMGFSERSREGEGPSLLNLSINYHLLQTFLMRGSNDPVRLVTRAPRAVNPP